jgi:hypothetical protein
MMKLYHGTNIDFKEIVLGKCKPNKDFGRGFYLTDIRQQALDMAVRRCDFEKSGSPFVQEYEFDESLLTSGELKVKRFDEVSGEWAEFVFANRKSKGKSVHEYDIVVGPIADDGVVFQLNLYQQHLITLEQLVQGLRYRRLNRQYYFGTSLAISKLKRV